MSPPIPSALRSVLPADAAVSWEAMRQILPPGVVLYGGTAIAAHLHHRVSRDLDFFYTDTTLDLNRLRDELAQLRPLAVTTLLDDTLNAVFGATKLQFLLARGQRALETPTVIAGIPVAGLRDLAATKIKVIGDRGELRDYFDLMIIEQRTHITVESALLDYQARYPTTDHAVLVHIVRALGSFTDVANDPSLPATRAAIERYWKFRQPQVVASLDSTGAIHPPSAPVAVAIPSHQVALTPPTGPGGVWVEPHLRNGRRVSGYWRRR